MFVRCIKISNILTFLDSFYHYTYSRRALKYQQGCESGYFGRIRILKTLESRSGLSEGMNLDLVSNVQSQNPYSQFLKHFTFSSVLIIIYWAQKKAKSYFFGFESVCFLFSRVWTGSVQSLYGKNCGDIHKERQMNRYNNLPITVHLICIDWLTKNKFDNWIK